MAGEEMTLADAKREVLQRMSKCFRPGCLSCQENEAAVDRLIESAMIYEHTGQ